MVAGLKGKVRKMMESKGAKMKVWSRKGGWNALKRGVLKGKIKVLKGKGGLKCFEKGGFQRGK